MRTIRKNQQSMKYALQIGEVPIYNRDENGEIIYEQNEIEMPQNQANSSIYIT